MDTIDKRFSSIQFLKQTDSDVHGIVVPGDEFMCSNDDIHFYQPDYS